MDLKSLTIASTRSAIAEKKISAVQVAEECYAKIDTEDSDDGIHAWLTLCRDRALEQAMRIDDLAAKRSPLPPLAGVPVGIKDVMVTRGVRTTAGSKILENFIPP